MNEENHEIESIQEVTAVPIGKTDIDTQVATAQRFPRKVAVCRQEAESLALLDEDTAAAMSYKLQRGGKDIEGPSVRLAEIMAGAWRNLRVDTRVFPADEKTVKAESVCWDLEKNVAIRTEVQRRITDKYGNRYKDDMIIVTGNAAASIAMRNSVFKIVPRAYVDQIREKAKKVACGDAIGLVELRTKWFGYWHRHGIVDEQLLAKLERQSIEDVTRKDIEALQGFLTSLKDGQSQLEDIFPPIEDASETRKAALAEKINRAKMAQAKPPAESKQEEQPADTGEMSEKEALLATYTELRESLGVPKSKAAHAMGVARLKEEIEKLSAMA